MKKMMSALVGFLLLCSCCICGPCLLVTNGPDVTNIPLSKTNEPTVSSGDMASQKTPAQPTEYKGKGSGEAFQYARDVMKQFLKFPDDAEFHSLIGDTKISANSSKLVWTIHSKVKAKNSFGAALTQPYRVDLQVDKYGDYDVIYVSLGNDTFVDNRTTVDTEYALALSETKWLKNENFYQSFVANQVYRWIENHGRIPSKLEGQAIIEAFPDVYGKVGRFQPDIDGFDVLYPGQDRQFETDDDVLSQHGVLEETISQPMDAGSSPELAAPKRRDDASDKQQHLVDNEQTDAELRESQFRNWQTADGKFSVEARMEKFQAGKVTLERRDNSEMVEVAEDLLSEPDQKYIQEEFKRRAKAAREQRKRTPQSD